MTAGDVESLSTATSRPRVLFVDDEPAILESLRRSVRREFAADLAIDGDHGLDYLRQGRPYCIVVSDMRMPGMDGVEFLAKVREISPQSVRVMLTGCDEIEVAVVAVTTAVFSSSSANRYRPKSCWRVSAPVWTTTWKSGKKSGS